MKKFKFKLEVVLEERKRIEDAKLREWMISERLLQGLKEQKQKFEQDLDNAVLQTDQLSRMAENSSAEFHVANAFIEGTKLRLQWKRQEIERGSKLTERKRLEYVAARQRREALEKLKARRKEDYMDQAKMRELKQLDDLYIMRAAYLKEQQSE